MTIDRRLRRIEEALEGMDLSQVDITERVYAAFESVYGLRIPPEGRRPFVFGKSNYENLCGDLRRIYGGAGAQA